MKITTPKNINYCATVVEIKEIFPLEGLDSLAATRIFDNQVLIQKDTKPGTVGLFFPVETQLSTEFLRNNNIYRNPELNLDTNHKGYFEDNGRIKCVKFRGFSSEGFFIEIDSLMSLGINPSELKIGDEFDELNGTPICSKYVVKQLRTPGSGGDKNPNNQVFVSKLVENQFNFHADTANLYKNIHVLKEDDIISISDKWHGTSGISSSLLCSMPLSRMGKILSWLGFDIVNVYYDNVRSSRNRVLNDKIGMAPGKRDFRTIADEELVPFIKNGMSIYYELVGYDENGKDIQKGYTYGFTKPVKDEKYTLGKHYGIYIYRITMTNSEGYVVEFSAKQVQDWCKQNGLMPVRQLFYGKVSELYERLVNRQFTGFDDNWKTELLKAMKEYYLEKDCEFCGKGIPAEGVVLRIESTKLKVFKLKSVRFLEGESKNLTKGVEDIESNG